MEFNIKNYLRPHLMNTPVYESSRPNENSGDLIYLHANESPLGLYNRYPDTQQMMLKAKLAELNRVAVENIFIGNGSDELIDLLMRIFCEPGSDSIMCLDPSFSMYEIYAKLNNLSVAKLPLNSSFEIHKKEYLELVKSSSPKLLFLCSPNNPTGNSIENIEYFISQFPGIVIVDEAYIEFSPNASTVNLLERCPNLIVLKTLSKAYGMAGLRIGAGFASREIAGMINRLKPPYNVSSESQRIALEELSNPLNIRRVIELVLREKSKMVKFLQQLEIVNKIYPSDANFLLIEFSSAEQVHEFLKQNGIFTSLRHPAISDCIRISIGTEKENEKLMNTLRQI